MTLVVQKEVPAIIIITALLCGLFVYAGSKIKKADPYAKPTGIVCAALAFIEWADGMVASTVRPSYVEKMGPYIGSLVAYLLCANLSGLFGFNTPTMNLSVTLSLTATSSPWALYSSAVFSTSARTSLYFSSPTKVLEDFFV